MGYAANELWAFNMGSLSGKTVSDWWEQLMLSGVACWLGLCSWHLCMKQAD